MTCEIQTGDEVTARKVAAVLATMAPSVLWGRLTEESTAKLRAGTLLSMPG